MVSRRVSRHPSRRQAESHRRPWSWYHRDDVVGPPGARLGVEAEDVIELPHEGRFRLPVLVPILAPDHHDALPCAQRVLLARRRKLHRHCLAAHAPLGHVLHLLRQRDLDLGGGRLNFGGGGGGRLLDAAFALGVAPRGGGGVGHPGHPVDLRRGEGRRAAHDQDLPLVQGHSRRCGPGDAELGVQERPDPRPRVVELDAGEHLGPPEDVVAAADGRELVLAEDDEPGARPGGLETRTLRPRAHLRIEDLAAAERLHPVLRRRHARTEGAAAHGVDHAVQGHAAVAPAGPV
mmetsp:Transcript_76250/g.200035  ORF Transcript_76250/g.200035 Transcript_76250/m.200035 type:complete len:291 (+) Transcript_76250:192-1064(+)